MDEGFILSSETLLDLNDYGESGAVKTYSPSFASPICASSG
jgi:hypothetical protein